MEPLHLVEPLRLVAAIPPALAALLQWVVLGRALHLVEEQVLGQPRLLPTPRLPPVHLEHQQLLAVLSPLLELDLAGRWIVQCRAKCLHEKFQQT